MSLADQIVALIETGWTNSTAIGKKVGCAGSYVRMVKQRKITAVEREYERGRERRLSFGPKQKEEMRAYQKKYRDSHLAKCKWSRRRWYYRTHHDIDIGGWKG